MIKTASTVQFTMDSTTYVVCVMILIDARDVLTSTEDGNSRETWPKFPSVLKHLLFLNNRDSFEETTRYQVPVSALWPLDYHGYKLGHTLRNYFEGKTCFELHEEAAIVALGFVRTAAGAIKVADDAREAAAVKAASKAAKGEKRKR